MTSQRRAQTLAVLGALGLASLVNGCRFRETELESGKPYNIVMITICSLRAQNLTPYGYRKNTTPAIDELARHAVVFKNAYAQSAYTLASMMSISTGLHPKSHGVFDVFKDVLSVEVKTLAEIFKENDYRTLWATKLDEPHLHPNAGFGRGFDDMIYLDDDFLAVSEVNRWMTASMDDPFFVSIHSRALHSPYIPLPEYKDRFNEGEKGRIVESDEEFYELAYHFVLDQLKVPGSRIYGLLDPDAVISATSVASPETDENCWERRMRIIHCMSPIEKVNRVGQVMQAAYGQMLETANEDNLAYVVSLYDASLLGIDQQLIRPVVQRLKELGIYDRTIIVVTADHGESLGEDRMFGHGMHLTDSVIHVPLIIKPAHSRDRHDPTGLAQTIDILPTLLQMTGIAAPGYVQGRSLEGALRGAPCRPIHEYVFGDNQTISYLRSRQWKLIVGNRDISLDRSDLDRLYNTERDPHEHRNMRESESAVYQGLRRRLLEHLESTQPIGNHQHEFPADIDQATRERIKKTGYW